MWCAIIRLNHFVYTIYNSSKENNIYNKLRVGCLRLWSIMYLKSGGMYDLYKKQGVGRIVFNVTP